MEEEWRSVVGYEGWYEVSTQGRVRSVAREIKFSDGRIRRYAPKVLSAYLGEGYLRVTLKRNGQADRVHVHVLVAQAFIGPKETGMEVCHWDGDRANAALSNLRYGTRKDNASDRQRHGTHVRYGQRRIPDAVVEAVRAAEGLTYAELAKRFSISVTHAFNIKNKHRRKD